jgi:hypothetical protein
MRVDDIREGYDGRAGENRQAAASAHSSRLVAPQRNRTASIDLHSHEFDAAPWTADGFRTSGVA